MPILLHRCIQHCSSFLSHPPFLMMPILFDGASTTHAQVFSTNLSFAGLLNIFFHIFNEEGGSGFPNSVSQCTLHYFYVFLLLLQFLLDSHMFHWWQNQDKWVWEAWAPKTQCIPDRGAISKSCMHGPCWLSPQPKVYCLLLGKCGNLDKSECAKLQIGFQIGGTGAIHPKIRNLSDLKQIKVSLNSESVAHQLAEVAGWLWPYEKCPPCTKPSPWKNLWGL